MHPESRLEVYWDGCAVRSPGCDVSHIADGLHVWNPVEEDVVLFLESAVGDASERRGEREGLCCQVEFEDILAGWGGRCWGDGLGNVVVVGGPLLGRKIRLNPVPAKFPLKFAKTPRGAGAREGLLGVGPGPNLSSTGCIWKLAGIVIPAPGLTGPEIAPGVSLSNRRIRREVWKRDMIQEAVFAQ
jgi:hypothetical protein